MTPDGVELVVITGATGRIGSRLRPRLVRPGRTLRLLDVTPPDAPGPGEDVVVADVADTDALTAAFTGAGLVVHLAGHPSERPWDEIMRVNVGGTRSVLEACHAAGVPRVLLASSIHAVGFETYAGGRDVPVPVPRPDSYYGVSKATVEALGSLYADRYGMAVVSARIGTAEAEPPHVRALSTWLSPGDAARLVEAAATAPPGHHLVWGVSRNTRRVVSLDAGLAIGFDPRDDAEAYAERLGSPPLLADELVYGAEFAQADHPIGGTW